ncbi:MAG: hypothetical protein AAF810_19825 [Cyanobacteria bacterium P01_D01_bin.36]
MSSLYNNPKDSERTPRSVSSEHSASDGTVSDGIPRSDEGEVRSVGWWLAGLFVIALLVRLMLLTSKSAWMDETSTMIFSLGNYSRLIPTNRIISLAEMVRPLQLTSGATAQDAALNLLAENNHPPAYFVIAHWWMMLFHRLTGQSADGTDISLWGARALPALFGALAVPATYLLALFSLRDSRNRNDATDIAPGAAEQQARLGGLLCAALMSVSPFSVFLSQEARHYTLAILTIIGSLCFFVLALKAVWYRRLLPWMAVLGWVVVNTFGIAVHYFSALACLSQGLVLLILLVSRSRQEKSVWRSGPWVRIYVAAVGTLAGALIWLPTLLTFYGSPQTTYIASTTRNLKFWIDPIVQSIVGWLYGIIAPVTSGFGWINMTAIVLSCVLLLLFYLPWLVANLIPAAKFQWQKSYIRPGLVAIGGFFLMANLVYFLICYVVGFDITRGHRYTFAYYPSLVLLVGSFLVPFWQFSTVESSSKFARVKLPFLKRFVSGRAFVLTLLVVGFLGTQTVVFDRSHLKFYKPDVFIDFVQSESTYPVVMGAFQRVGDQPSVLNITLISAAWEVQRQQVKSKTDGEAFEWASEPRFFLIEDNSTLEDDPVALFEELITELPRPFDVWALSSRDLSLSAGCRLEDKGRKASFSYRHIVCER